MPANDEFWTSEIEESPEPGKAMEKRPRGPSEADKYRAPDRITPKWIRQQLPKTVWDELPRNTKLNEFIISNMCDDAKRGLSKRAIMARAGFAVATWYAWEKRAAEGDEPYALWYRCMMVSAASLEEELLDSMYEQAVITRDFKATQFMLKQNNKEEYADDPKLSVNIGKIEEKTSINYINHDHVKEVGSLLAQLGLTGPVVDAEVVEEDEDED